MTPSGVEIRERRGPAIREAVEFHDRRLQAWIKAGLDLLVEHYEAEPSRAASGCGAWWPIPWKGGHYRTPINWSPTSGNSSSVTASIRGSSTDQLFGVQEGPEQVV